MCCYSFSQGQKSLHNTAVYVTNILMQQSDWCKINTLMQHSDWCEIHTLKWQSDQCKIHTPLFNIKKIQEDNSLVVQPQVKINVTTPDIQEHFTCSYAYLHVPVFSLSYMAHSTHKVQLVHVARHFSKCTEKKEKLKEVGSPFAVFTTFPISPLNLSHSAFQE